MFPNLSTNISTCTTWLFWGYVPYPKRDSNVSIHDFPCPIKEWFQARGHGWDRLGAPETQGWESTEASASRWQDICQCHRLSLLKVIFPGRMVFPTIISHLPGLLTTKPGAESKGLPSTLTAGNEKWTGDRKRCFSHLFSFRSYPKETQKCPQIPCMELVVTSEDWHEPVETDTRQFRLYHHRTAVKTDGTMSWGAAWQAEKGSKEGQRSSSTVWSRHCISHGGMVTGSLKWYGSWDGEGTAVDLWLHQKWQRRAT